VACFYRYIAGQIFQNTDPLVPLAQLSFQIHVNFIFFLLQYKVVKITILNNSSSDCAQETYKLTFFSCQAYNRHFLSVSLKIVICNKFVENSSVNAAADHFAKDRFGKLLASE
jgi:hypothetical protein